MSFERPFSAFISAVFPDRDIAGRTMQGRCRPLKKAVMPIAGEIGEEVQSRLTFPKNARRPEYAQLRWIFYRW